MGAKGLPFSLKYKSAALALLLFSFPCFGEIPSGIQFRAQFYQRDLAANILRGKGEAWVKNGNQEMSADEIEVDFKTNRAVAKGNVKLQEKNTIVWADHADLDIKGPGALFEKATLSSGKMVITGERIRRTGSDSFEVDEGTYSNCNIELTVSNQIGECPLDWKISGRRFSLRLGGYGHFYDVVMSAKGIPIVYLPYAFVPIKNKRESGLLMPAFPFSATLGSGVTLPLFLALSDWQDLLIRPTYYSTTGMVLGMQYRYIYSPDKSGEANFTLLSRRFSAGSNPRPNDKSRPLTLGFGEASVRIHNTYSFTGSRSHTRQMINYVSNPFFTFDYAGEVGPRADLGNLRSQVTFTRPGDEWLFSGQAQYLQSLVVSKDSGVDRGEVAQLPILTAAKTTTPLLGQLVSYELDTQFTNFTRTAPIDQLATSPEPGVVSSVANPYYLRTGRRLQIEPRLVTSFPMPRGFQLQPLLRTGSLVYLFDHPDSRMVHREYMDIEIPFSLQLSRVYSTSITGYEKIRHVFQPRFVYASSLIQTPQPDHPFFFQDSPSGLSNPRFDILDQFTNYEFMRFELINRFQKRTSAGSDRFFWFQLSEQYNVKKSTTDPRYTTNLGPIELFSALTLGNYSMQLQGSYSLEPTKTLNGQSVTPVREAFLTTGISYKGAGRDVVSLNALYRQSANPGLRAQMINLSFYKELPTFFDLEAYAEYNFLTRQVYGYRVGFHFRTKPRSCWRFSVLTGSNAYRTQFTTFNFAMNFGAGDE